MNQTKFQKTLNFNNSSITFDKCNPNSSHEGRAKDNPNCAAKLYVNQDWRANVVYAWGCKLPLLLYD